jgi:hypothetical protein
MATVRVVGHSFSACHLSRSPQRDNLPGLYWERCLGRHPDTLPSTFSFQSSWRGWLRFSPLSRGDRNFFEPVWSKAGFRFLPWLDFSEMEGLRLGLMSLLNRREATAAYLAVVIGNISDPTLLRESIRTRALG